VKLVDANVLLYAVNERAERHEASRSWLEASLSGADTVGFAWLPLVAFLRIATKAGLFPEPLTIVQAVDQMERWLAPPAAVIVEPTARHLTILRDLLLAVGATGGNLVNDAHLAALAVEHRAGIVSFDHDFSRFPGVAWTMPT
jgi:uncharacterized protein